MAHHDHAADDDPGLSGPLVTQADRYQWQGAAVRELAAILEAHADLPAIMWTIGLTGSLKGTVIGLASHGDTRDTFDAWRKALQLGAIAEHAVSGGTAMYLRGSIRRNGIKVTVAASIPVGAAAGTVRIGVAAPIPRSATQSTDRAPSSQGGRGSGTSAPEPLSGIRTRDSTARAPLPPPCLPDGLRPVHAR
jgi:hypothetical protein